MNDKENYKDDNTTEELKSRFSSIFEKGSSLENRRKTADPNKMKALLNSRKSTGIRIYTNTRRLTSSDDIISKFVKDDVENDELQELTNEIKVDSPIIRSAKARNSLDYQPNKKRIRISESATSPKHPIETLDKINSVLEKPDENTEEYRELKQRLTPPLPDSSEKMSRSRRSTVSPTLLKETINDLTEINNEEEDDKIILPDEKVNNSKGSNNNRRSTIDSENLNEVNELLNGVNDILDESITNNYINDNESNKSRRNTADPSMIMTMREELNQSDTSMISTTTTTDLMKIIKDKEKLLEEEEEDKEAKNRRNTVDPNEMKSVIDNMLDKSSASIEPSSTKKRRGRPRKSSTPKKATTKESIIEEEDKETDKNNRRNTVDPNEMKYLVDNILDNSTTSISEETPSKRGKRGRPRKTPTPKAKPNDNNELSIDNSNTTTPINNNRKSIIPLRSSILTPTPTKDTSSNTRRNTADPEEINRLINNNDDSIIADKTLNTILEETDDEENTPSIMKRCENNSDNGNNNNRRSTIDYDKMNEINELLNNNDIVNESISIPESKPNDNDNNDNTANVDEILTIFNEIEEQEQSLTPSPPINNNKDKTTTPQSSESFNIPSNNNSKENEVISVEKRKELVKTSVIKHQESASPDIVKSLTYDDDDEDDDDEVENNNNNNKTNTIELSPKTSVFNPGRELRKYKEMPTPSKSCLSEKKIQKPFRVMFTEPDVAVFEKTQPPNNMTPLPKGESKSLYPIISDSSSSSVSESQVAEDEITAQNSQILDKLSESDSFDDKKWDNIINKNPRASMKLRRLNNFEPSSSSDSSNDSMDINNISNSETIVLPSVDHTVPISETIKQMKNMNSEGNNNKDDSMNVNDESINTDTMVLPTVDKTVPIPTLNKLQQSVTINNNNKVDSMSCSADISDMSQSATTTMVLPITDHTVPLNQLSKLSTQIQQQQQQQQPSILSSQSFDNSNDDNTECITMTLPVTDKTVPLKTFHEFASYNNNTITNNNVLFTFNKPQTIIQTPATNTNTTTTNFTINTISPIVPNTENRISPAMDILADTFDDNSSTINTTKNILPNNNNNEKIIEEESPIKPLNVRESIIQSNLIKKNGLICLESDNINNEDREVNKFTNDMDNFVDALLQTKDINKIPKSDNNSLKRKADVLLQSNNNNNNNTTTLLPTLQQQQQQPTVAVVDENEEQLHVIKKKKLSVVPENINNIKPITITTIPPLSNIKKRLSIYNNNNNNNSTMMNKDIVANTATAPASVVSIIPELPITDYSYLNVSSSTSSSSSSSLQKNNKSNRNSDSLPSVDTITPTTTLSPIDQSYHSRREIINASSNMEIEENNDDNDNQPISSDLSFHSDGSQYNSVIKIIEEIPPPQQQSQQQQPSSISSSSSSSSPVISSNEIINNNNNDKSLSILHNESVISSIPYRTSSSSSTTIGNQSFEVCEHESDNQSMNMPSISIKISPLEITLAKYANDWVNQSLSSDSIDLIYYYQIPDYLYNIGHNKQLNHYVEMVINNINEENVYESEVEMTVYVYPKHGWYYDINHQHGVYDISSKIKTLQDFLDNVDELNKSIHTCEDILNIKIKETFDC